jgi:hypothetical protein
MYGRFGLAVSTQRNVIRIEESRDGLRDARDDIGRWLQRRRECDALRQHWTQLSALERVLATALGRVEAEVDGTRASQRTGVVYEECRRNERRTVLVRRYWQYFRDKWDQRDDPELGATLRAADEVVWSCWASPFTVNKEPVGAAPLPYVEPFFTPRAIPRVTPPADLRQADDLLRPALRRLPVPVIGLPPACVSRPWWLAALAHETGHHLQHDLDSGAIHARFPDVLESAADTSSGHADGYAWREWHEEVFADAFSVLMLGSAAAWTTMELVRGADSAQFAADERYPAPVVRSALMAHTLRSAGCRPRARDIAFQPEKSSRIRLEPDAEELRRSTDEHVALARHVASRLVEVPVAAGRSLPEVCGWVPARFAERGELTWWRDELLSAGDLLAEQQAHSARLALAGGVAAWRSIAANSSAEERARKGHRLSQRLLSLLPQCRPAGKRSGREPVEAAIDEPKDALVDVLFGDYLGEDH